MELKTQRTVRKQVSQTLLMICLQMKKATTMMISVSISAMIHQTMNNSDLTSLILD